MQKKYQILSSFFHNSFPEDIRKKVELWLLNPHSLLEKEKALRMIWDEIELEPDNSTKESFIKTQNKINSQTNNSSTRKIPYFLWIAKIAVIMLLILLPAGGVYVYFQHQEEPQQVEWVECFAPDGKIFNITLPDSSIAILNAGSVLIYPKEFNKKTRNIYLNGQAEFKVKKNKAQPFIVNINYLDVEAIGTEFDINSYSSGETTYATLNSGKIKVTFKNLGDRDSLTSKNFVFLNPGEQLAYNRESGKINIKTVNLNYSSAWKSGHLVFQHASMSEIATSLERRFGVTVYCDFSKYDTEFITVKFIHGESLEESLHILELIVTNFKYRIEGKKIFIY